MKTMMSLFFLIISLTLFAQDTLTKLEDLKGIWVNSNDKCDITIYKELELISIYDDNEYGSISFEEICFIKKGQEDKKLIDGKDAYTKIFNERSKYFITIHKGRTAHLDYIYRDWDELKYGANLFFEFNPKYLMVISNVNDHYYHRVHRLPKTALKMLYDRCVEDGVDYMKQYLEIDVQKIISEKSYIYDSLEVKTNMYLIKNDLITVKGEKNDFFKMEYETNDKKIITGLIKKENVEGIKE